MFFFFFLLLGFCSTSISVTNCGVETLDNDFSPIVFDLEKGVGKYVIETRENEQCSISYEEVEAFSVNFLNEKIKSNDDDNPCDLFADIFHSEFDNECFPDDWETIELLGEGHNAHVYSTIGPNGETGALKIQHESGGVHIDDEIMMNILFHHVGLSTEFKRHCAYKKHGKSLDVTHIGRIDMTLETYLENFEVSDNNLSILYNKIFKVFDRMKKNGLRHGDLSLANIGFVVEDDGKRGILQVIDFGLSRLGSNIPSDMMHLTSSLYFLSKHMKHTHFDILFREEIFGYYGYKFPREEHEFSFFRSSYSKYSLHLEELAFSRARGVSVCEKYEVDNNVSIGCP